MFNVQRKPNPNRNIQWKYPSGSEFLHAFEFLDRIYKADTFWRWLAISVLPPSVFRQLRLEKMEEWPEAACGSHLWMSVEDYIIRTCIKPIELYDGDHTSLHFDGIRVGLDTMNAYITAVGERTSEEQDLPVSTVFIKRCESYIY